MHSDTDRIEAPNERLRHACADLGRRLRAGDDARAEEYFARWPDLQDDPEHALELILHEFAAREEAGQSPAQADWLARFPQYRDRLERLFVLLADEPSDPTGDPTQPAAVPARGLPKSPPSYELLERVGSGGMGVVYKALQRGTGREVAVKMLIAGPDADDADLARLRAEAEAVARLQHPNIVQIYEVGDCNGLPFLALEYVPGGSLAGRLSSGPLPARDAAELIRALADAVAYAHSRGIVHRDIKPANVLIGSGSWATGPASPPAAHCLLHTVPKLSDFGLAKCLDRPGASSTTAVVGTASYMAPEQAAGESKRVGPACDVYALGAVLYECLTGGPPHRGETMLETLRHVQTTDPVPPRRLRPGLPRDLETVVLQCLSKEPARRYASADALADDLRRFLDGGPVRARPLGPLGRAVRWARRRPAAAVLLIFAAAAVAAAVAGVVAHNASLRRVNDDLARTNDRLTTALGRASRTRYAAHMGLALQAQEAGQSRRLFELLAAQTPAETGGEDYRCFEWYYLRALSRDGRIAELPSPGARVRGVAFAPDGRTLAAIGDPGSVLIWDVAGKRARFAPTLPRDRGPSIPVGMAFAPDGRTLAAADGRLHFWDVAAGTERPEPDPRRARSVAYSPDGQTLALGHDDGTVTLTDAAAGAVRQTLRGHRDGVTALTFSPDGAALVSVALLTERDPTARVWDVAAGTLRASLPASPAGTVNAAAFSPDGATLALAEGLRHELMPPGRIRFLNAATLKDARPPWPVPAGGAFGIAFAPDGQTLAAGTRSGAIRQWDVATGQERVTLPGHADRVDTLAFSPDGRTLAAGGIDGTAALWDPAARVGPEVIRSPARRNRSFRAVAVAPDGSFAVGGADGRVRFYDPAAGRFRADTVPGTEKGGTAIAYSPDGRFLASPAPVEGGGPNDPAVVVELREAATGRLVHALAGHTDRVLGVAFGHDGTTLVSGGYDGTVRLWDAATGEPRGTCDGYPDRVWCVAIGPDGRTVAAGGRGGEVRLWDVATRTPLGPPLTDHGPTVHAIAFAPDGRSLAAGAWGGRVKVWDLATFRVRAEFREVNSVLTLAYSPDGATLATGGPAGAVRLWDPLVGQERFALKGPGNWVQGVAFAPDGAALYASSDDGTVHVWRAPRGP